MGPSIRDRASALIERMSPRARQWATIGAISAVAVGVLWTVFAMGSGDSPQRSAVAAGAGDLKPTNVDLMAPGAQVREVEAWVGQAGKKPPSVAILRGALKPTMVYAMGANAVTPGDTYDITVEGDGVTTTEIAITLPATNVTISAVANASETFTAAAHGMVTGDGPYRLTNSGGGLPSGTSVDTDYWIIKLTADTFQLATSYANAIAETELLISSDGTGTHTISAGTGCRRPATVADGVNTNNVGGAALAADAAVTLTLATDGTKLVLAAGDELRCDVVSLYRGGNFDLYKYKRYQDVRLVFAPEFDIAFFGGDPDGAERVARALRLTQLTDLAHRFVDSLSGGQAQRVWLASCLAQDTPIILLDEPTNHLDLRHQIELLALLRSLADDHGATLGVVLHDLNQAAAIADEVCSILMGEDVESRKHFIQTNARDVRFLDI